MLNVHNLSSMEIVLGDVSYQVFDQSGAFITVLSVKGIKIDLDDNSFPATTSPISKGHYRVMITMGTTVTLRGYDGWNPLLTQVMKQLKLTVPGVKVNPAA
jgi:hypothetical protein